jgi:hypothetical protein
MIDLRDTNCDVGTCSMSCPVADFGIRSVITWGSAVTWLVHYYNCYYCYGNIDCCSCVIENWKFSHPMSYLVCVLLVVSDVGFLYFGMTRPYMFSVKQIHYQM